MADVKPLVIKSNGDKSELSISDTLIIPLLSSHPSGNPPSGYIYIYGFSDKNIYQKNSDGVVSNLASSSGGAGGNNKEVQYNNNGSVAGAANVEIESGNLFLIEASDPVSIPSGAIVYASNIGGRVIPKWVSSSGAGVPFQSGIFFNQVSLISASGGALVGTLGCAVTNVGTISNPAIASTNVKSQSRRFVNTSAATAGSLASTRVANLECWRGNVAGAGGFFTVCRFGLSTLQSGMRAFFGLSSTATTAPINVDPITTTTDAKIGMAINTNTGNWNLIHNSAGVAPTVIPLGANFSVNTNDMIEAIFFAQPNGASVTYLIKNLQTNSQTSGTISTNLPANTVFLGRLMWATNNATAASVAWDCSRFGLETDF